MSTDPIAEQHFRDLERMYHSSPINGVIPSRLKVWDGGAETHTRVGREYWHSAHSMHGSMYFKALDIDASEAKKHPELRDLLLGSHPADRIQLTVGRDLQLGEGHRSGPLNYFVYPLVEVDGERLEGVETRFRYAEPSPTSSEP